MGDRSHIAKEERTASRHEPVEPLVVRPARCETKAEPPFIIEADLPEEPPVTRGMLDIMERYIGDILDEVLGDKRL